MLKLSAKMDLENLFQLHLFLERSETRMKHHIGYTFTRHVETSRLSVLVTPQSLSIRSIVMGMVDGRVISGQQVEGGRQTILSLSKLTS